MIWDKGGSATLLLLDMQKSRLDSPERAHRVASRLETVANLLVWARSAGIAVVHVRHGGVEGDTEVCGVHGEELYYAPLAGEAVVDRAAADAFAHTGLARLIRAGSLIIVAGVTSDQCIRSTVLSALGRGYAVQLVRGALGICGSGRPAEILTWEIEQELCEAGAELVQLREPLSPRAESDG